MGKSVRITKENKAQAWAQSDARFEHERTHIHRGKSRPSTGADQKRAERDIRDMLNVEGITYTGDLRARGANRDDITTRDKYGNRLTIEVKHGGGSIAYACNSGVRRFESRDREYCLPGVDYVVYHISAECTKRTRMAWEYMVSTRDDFLDMLEEYCHGPKACGWETAVKFSNADHAAINIQSRYIEQFWAGMQSDERAMSLWEFCTEVLGRDPRWER